MYVVINEGPLVYFGYIHEQLVSYGSILLEACFFHIMVWHVFRKNKDTRRLEGRFPKVWKIVISKLTSRLIEKQTAKLFFKLQVSKIFYVVNLYQI